MCRVNSLIRFPRSAPLRARLVPQSPTHLEMDAPGGRCKRCHCVESERVTPSATPPGIKSTSLGIALPPEALSVNHVTRVRSILFLQGLWGVVTIGLSAGPLSISNSWALYREEKVPSMGLT